MPPTIVRELELDAPRLQDLSAARLLRRRTPTAARCSSPTTPARGTPRSRSSRTPTPTRTNAGTRGSAASPRCSVRCSRRSRPASGRCVRATSSTRRGWRGRCGGSASPASATSRGCSRSSIADLLDEWFESPQMQGVLSVSGVIGTWAGPRSPGTAYVMAHHKIGDVGDGQLGVVGLPRGRHGRGEQRAARRGAIANGATVRTDAPVARIDVRDGRVRGVTLESGEELRADVVIAATHPKITFLEQIDRAELPDDFVDAIRALEDPQRHREGERRRRPAARVHAPSPASIPRCTAARSCSPSRSTTSRARSRTRSAGRPRACRSPTSASRRCSTRRSRPRASTSCRCSRSGCRTSGRRAENRDELERVRRPGRRARRARSRPASPTRSCTGR